MRILVTGGAGFIGTHTVKALIDAGHFPVVIDNLKEIKNEVITSKLNIPLIKSNIGNKKILIEILTGKHNALKNTVHEDKFIEMIIHFAALSNLRDSVENPLNYYQNNVTETINLLEVICDSKLNLLRKESIPIPIIFSSTCATYGIPYKLPIDENCPQNPITPYGRTKLIIEMLIKELSYSHNLKSVILRYFNAAGASQNGLYGENRKKETHLIPLAINAALGINKNLNIYGLDHPTFDGSCIRDYVHVLDIAEAHLLAIEKIKNELISKTISNKFPLSLEENYFEYNIGLEKGFSVLQIINKVEEIVGNNCPYTVIKKKQEEPAILIASSKKIRRELRWKPKFNKIDDIVLHSFNWIKKYNNL
tara:strand:+ start:369 stop:1463 length:1095 start_codon:yes stop_codon:yes gene_type:complete